MLRALFFAPLLFILVLFALSNPQIVHLGMWPTDVVVDLPLSITVLIAMAVSFVTGSVLLWISVLGARMRARRAESHVRSQQAEIADLKARITRMATAQQPTNTLTLPGSALLVSADRS
jgi:uncharacterized integral membrane protein